MAIADSQTQILHGHVAVIMAACVLPTDARRNNNVIFTSKRRRFDITMTLFLRRVSPGLVYKIGIWLMMLTRSRAYAN